MHAAERVGDCRESGWEGRGYGLANAGERVGIGKLDSIYRIPHSMVGVDGWGCPSDAKIEGHY